MSGAAMQRRRVGRSAVELSVVGFGTCQLRLIPEDQAVRTLRCGFELGVNWVHASPDYAADELVARAIRESGRDVVPVGDGSGDGRHFAHCFERALRLYGREPLPLWGISCIDDQEFVGRNVWGPGGMVEFLEERKREGRLLASYCTTHGPPEYVADLVTCGAFDAIMLAWNPLGFHVLSSYAASEGKRYEEMARARAEVFPLAAERGVSLLVMKALAGGLLGESRAFPPRARLAEERADITATEVLRHVLAQEGVTAVLPGVGSPEEAEEDARAGCGPLELAPERERLLLDRIGALRVRLCSRCGECEPTCSQGLPISWLFREAYIWLNPADTFDAVERLSYFHLHPEEQLACVACSERSCHCEQGLDVPAELGRVHAALGELRARGCLPRTPRELERAPVGTDPALRVVQWELPTEPARGGELARLWLENAGCAPWLHAGPAGQRTWLEVRQGRRRLQRVALREEVRPGARTHLAFRLELPHRRREPLRLVLRSGARRQTEIARLEVRRT